MCASGHSTLGCRSRPQVQEKELSWCAHLKAPSSPYFHRLEHPHHSIIKELSSCNVPLPQEQGAFAVPLKREQVDQTGNEGLARHSRGSGGA